MFCLFCTSSSVHLRGLVAVEGLTRRLFLESVIFPNFWPVSCTEPPPAVQIGSLERSPPASEPARRRVLFSARGEPRREKIYRNLLLITLPKRIAYRWHLFQSNLNPPYPTPPLRHHNLFIAAVHIHGIGLANSVWLKWLIAYSWKETALYCSCIIFTAFASCFAGQFYFPLQYCWAQIKRTCPVKFGGGGEFKRLRVGLSTGLRAPRYPGGGGFSPLIWLCTVATSKPSAAHGT